MLPYLEKLVKLIAPIQNIQPCFELFERHRAMVGLEFPRANDSDLDSCQ